MQRASVMKVSCLLFGLLLASWNAHAAPPKGALGHDPVMHWNAVALDAVVHDHSGTYGAPEQGGPTRASRALAIVHIAIFDAVNAIDRSHTPYIPVTTPAEGAVIDAAVAQAAHATLVTLYPNQEAALNAQLNHALAQIRKGPDRDRGILVGFEAAMNILAQRHDDGAADGNTPLYPLTSNPPVPGEHLPDPINPNQGLLTPGWGAVDTFSGVNVAHPAIRTPPPPALTDARYTADYLDVLTLGGDGVVTPTLRTQEQTEIGLFWAYDGAKGIGVPPVLYNQVVRALAKQEHHSIVQNARLFALVNIAMADAGIASWDSKYFYNVWRPVVAIRNGDLDGNGDTEGVSGWMPLGAPASNRSGTNFTPPFPSYPSGHATFGAAMFKVLSNYYGTDDMSYQLSSDEMSGRTTDSTGMHRHKLVRRYDSFSEATIENARSRIYLGIHYQFDADSGIDQGIIIADHVFEQLLQPVE